LEYAKNFEEAQPDIFFPENVSPAGVRPWMAEFSGNTGRSLIERRHIEHAPYDLN
jgi:hypothetical protein